MIDHLTLKVSNLAASKTFYAAALAPLGYTVQMEFETGAGLGTPGKPDLWLAQDAENARPMHLAMGTADRKAVDAFHAAALAAGGKDNGPPGVRTDYHPNYYAAFVHDPDGHNLEVVCHVPPGAAVAPAAKAKAPAKAKAKGVAKKAVAAKKPARKVAAKKKGRR